MARRRLPWRGILGVGLMITGLALGWLWFRESAFVSVRDVEVVGATSSEEKQINEALVTAGRGMSTLAVDEGELKGAVEPFKSVAGLRIRSDFPRTLRVEVIEHRPVAVLKSGSGQIPVTGSGILLDGVKTEGLPQVTSRKPIRDGRITERRALSELKVAAAAPDELRERIDRMFWNADGLAVELDQGPELIFGSPTDVRDKWGAAARVLAEQSSSGATYLDLRSNGLVAAGGVGPVRPEPTPETASSGQTTGTVTSDTQP